MENNFGCVICFCPFNDAENQPRVLPNCGHSLCRECILNSSVVDFVIQTHENPFRTRNMPPNENLREKTNIKLTCPFCKTVSQNTKVGAHEKPQVLDYFPINYSLISALDIIDTQRSTSNKCRKHHSIANILCFEKDCDVRELSCFACFKEGHLKCDPALALDSNSILSRVRYTNYETSFKDFSNDLNNIKKAVLASLQNEIEAVIDSFEGSLKKHFFDLVKHDMHSYQIHFDKFDMAFSSGEVYVLIDLQPRNKKEVDSAITHDKLSSLLHRTIVSEPLKRLSEELKHLVNIVTISPRCP